MIGCGRLGRTDGNPRGDFVNQIASRERLVGVGHDAAFVSFFGLASGPGGQFL